MATVFFDHLIHFEEVISEIDAHALDAEERDELVRVIDEIFHNRVLTLILNHLPADHHADFVTRLHANPSSPDHLTFLKSRVTTDIEQEIVRHSRNITTDLINEIKKSKLPLTKTRHVP